MTVGQLFTKKTALTVELGWTDKYPHQINKQFANKVIYPGFIEAHAHPLLAGILFNQPLRNPSPRPNPWGPAFPGIPNLQTAIVQLKKYAADIKYPDQTLLAWGWDETAMGKVPDRAFLDSISKTRPIIVWDNSGHDMYIHSAAIQAYAITPEKVKDIPGAGLDQAGQLNGPVLEIHGVSNILSVAGKVIFNPNENPNA